MQPTAAARLLHPVPGVGHPLNAASADAAASRARKGIAPSGAFRGRVHVLQQAEEQVAAEERAVVLRAHRRQLEVP